MTPHAREAHRPQSGAEAFHHRLAVRAMPSHASGARVPLPPANGELAPGAWHSAATHDASGHWVSLGLIPSRTYAVQPLTPGHHLQPVRRTPLTCSTTGNTARLMRPRKAEK